MKLNVLERIKALQVLPKETNFVTLKIVKDLQEALSLNESELNEFEIKQVGDSINWNDKGKEAREIEIGERASDIIKEALQKLDKENKLTSVFISLYEKFVNGKEN